MNKDENRRGRKAYGKPEVRRIELRPEESLAAGCKTVAIPAPAQPNCAIGTCFEVGS